MLAPEKKTWWRNFTGDDEGPITLMNFDGADRAGHCVAAQDEQGRVAVRVRLNP